MSLPTLGQMLQSNNQGNQPNNQEYQPSNQINQGYQTVPGFQQVYVSVWSNEINDLKNRYGMQIPANQIDASFEQAKQNKRMYKFPTGPDNYIRFDERGKSYIAIANAFDWSHKSNSQYWGTKNDPNCYAGTSAYLKAVCWIDTNFSFDHVKPGNYQLFINQGFENKNINDELSLKVMVGDKEVFKKDQYPDEQMAKNKNLKEYYICDIKQDAFDLSKADPNGDFVVKVVFGKRSDNWKSGWVIDGGRLVQTN